ncbi:NAD(P)H-dependent oxidoreductase subunit E [Propionivibrio sp.]|uniref:NAD(P)H-dependent oxidoreductase subunit E n=1 Tax=Propionivibrio sp. TaxID=2212460 RepID=UPI00345D2DF3
MAACAERFTGGLSMGGSSHCDYLDPILNRYRHRPDCLLQMLREGQEQFGYVHPDAIDYLSEKLKLPRARVEGVASFYSFLHLQPCGKYRVLFSDNITDRMLGNQTLLERMCRNLWVERGKVSEDGLVSIDYTSCTGMCDQGPAVLVNGQALTGMTTERIDRICELIRAKAPLSEWPSAYFAVADNIRRRDVLLSGDWPAGEAIRAAIARGAVAMLAELKLSNLRGRGGAGFTTHIKWESAREAPCHAGKPARYIVCNADEGEPGTFKDRVLLNSYADLLFDGMTVAGFTVGAATGLAYLRGEYHYLLPALLANLEQRRRNGLLGSPVCSQAGFDFDIEIHLGAGAYVCGEESALLESLEGKRGIPRNRPPYPVTEGYLGQPTVVNNVETLCKAALIALRGGAWFSGLGTKQSTGTKLLSISGDVENPGIYEYPFGISGGSGAQRLRCGQRAGDTGQRTLGNLPGDARVLASHCV